MPILVNKRYLFFAILYFVFITEKECYAQESTSSNGKSSHAFAKEIPVTKDGKFPSYYLHKDGVEKRMNLVSLEKGYDSIQIRIWYGYARTDSSQLIILKKDNQGWSSLIYNFIYYYNYTSKRIDSIATQRISKTPLSGWSSFSRSLFRLSIATLPDISNIPNYPDYADGSGVIVEIATQKYYRIYNYEEPHLLVNSFPQASQIEKILKLIQREFDFKQLHIL